MFRIFALLAFALLSLTPASTQTVHLHPVLTDWRPVGHVTLANVSDAPLPAQWSVDRTIWPGIGNQGSVGACVSFAAIRSSLSFLYRQRTGQNIIFSPRYAYDLVTNGADEGSNLAWYPNVIASGLPRSRAFPYGARAVTLGLAAYADDAAIPDAVVKRSIYRLGVTENYAYEYSGQEPAAGAAGLDALKATMLAHNAPGQIVLPVFPEWDGASRTGGYVGPVQPGEQSRGLHEVAVVGWDDSRGVLIVANSWGTNFGDHGWVYLSYSYFETYALEATVLTLDGVH